MRIVRFSPGPDSGLGTDPLFGVLEDDATITVITGDPIYSGIQKTAATVPVSKVACLHQSSHVLKLFASVRTMQITQLKWVGLCQMNPLSF